MRSTSALRAFAILAVVTTFAATAFAGSSADANLGADAGDTQAAASSLAYGAYAGYLDPHDEDWYALAAAAGPTCIDLKYAATGNNQSVAYLLATPTGTRGASRVVPQGTGWHDALAVPAVQRTYLDTRAAPNDPVSGAPARAGNYSFALRGVGIPTAGDALAASGDAGGSWDRAAPVASGCVGGHLDPTRYVGDFQDDYSLGTVPAGRPIALSFATSAPALQLALVDTATGTVVALLASGDAVSVASTGTSYGLAVSRTDLSVADAGYLIGVITDPGNPCRPQC